jgi:hypothetical protein
MTLLPALLLSTGVTAAPAAVASPNAKAAPR